MYVDAASSHHKSLKRVVQAAVRINQKPTAPQVKLRALRRGHLQLMQTEPAAEAGQPAQRVTSIAQPTKTKRPLPRPFITDWRSPIGHHPLPITPQLPNPPTKPHSPPQGPTCNDKSSINTTPAGLLPSIGPIAWLNSMNAAVAPAGTTPSV